MKHPFMFLAAGTLVQAGVISTGGAEGATSRPTYACTPTVTKYKTVRVQARDQTCPPPVTVTVTAVTEPSVVTVVDGDPSSISSSFVYASSVDSIVNENSIEDRPTGNPPETTPVFFTHTASGPAIVGTHEPNDGAPLYHFSGTAKGPVATTVFSFPPADKPTGAHPAGPRTSTSTVMATVYNSTVYAAPASTPLMTSPSSNSSLTGPGLQKRQTCTMVFAEISGQWASWCNNWDGSTVVSYSTYNSTTLATSVYGAEPVPESVYDPSHTLSSTTRLALDSSSLSTWPLTDTAQDPTLSHTSPADPTSISHPASTPHAPSSTKSGAGATSIVATASVVVTYPVTTIVETISSISASSTSTIPAPPSSTCGQVGIFKITFDDLPQYSTTNPNSTDAPPIFDPYDHFYWSSGYSYGPPPHMPYAPHDGDGLAMYNPADATPIPYAAGDGRDQPGSFGAGPRASNNIFWFDAMSAYVGCNNTGTTVPCNIMATGYRWIRSLDGQDDGHEEVAFAQQFAVPACDQSPCQLGLMSFDPAEFSGLSTINFAAQLGNEAVGFYLDTFQASWTNSTCAAGLQRISSRK